MLIFTEPVRVVPLGCLTPAGARNALTGALTFEPVG